MGMVPCQVRGTVCNTRHERLTGTGTTGMVQVPYFEHKLIPGSRYSTPTGMYENPGGGYHCCMSCLAQKKDLPWLPCIHV